MTRFENWPRLLAEYIEARVDLPFSWDGSRGQCCASFGIGAVEAITGVRIWDVNWHDEREALEAIKAAGGWVAAISSVLGAPSQNWAEAQRGDVGLGCLNDSGRQSVLVCTGQSFVGPGIDRLEHVPLDAVGYFWRV